MLSSPAAHQSAKQPATHSNKLGAPPNYPLAPLSNPNWCAVPQTQTLIGLYRTPLSPSSPWQRRHEGLTIASVSSTPSKLVYVWVYTSKLLMRGLPIFIAWIITLRPIMLIDISGEVIEE